MAPKPNAGQSLNAMIQADRKKKKNEALADRMLGSGRRSSLPATTKPNRRAVLSGPGASLASRVGVSKRSSPAVSKPDIDGNLPMQDMLHHNQRVRRDRDQKIQDNMQRELIAREPHSQLNIRSAPMTIRGLAATGPFVVIASNFAPGTTAADIEAAMSSVGGEVTSCRLVASNPTVMAELVVVTKDGAENIISTFNNQKADGRLLYVYMKAGGPSPIYHNPVPSQKPSFTPAPIVAQSVIAANTSQSRPPPTGPRNTEPATRRNAEDVMEVDVEPSSEDVIPLGVRPEHHRQHPPPYEERRRGGGGVSRSGYQDGRYGYNERYDNSRDSHMNSGYRGRSGLYSDEMYRGGAGYRR